MFEKLRYAIRRRTLDNKFLPSAAPLPYTTSIGNTFYGLLFSFDDLLYALSTNVDVESDRNAETHVSRASSLPTHLQRAYTTLTEIEAEAVQMGTSIEMNSLRQRRGDPRARTEADLAAWRNDAYTRWDGLLRDLLVEDKAFRELRKKEKELEKNEREQVAS